KHVIVTRTTLSNLLVWFFEDYISTETPQQLAAQISQFQSATDESSHLPQGLESYKRLQENLRGWFEALAYKFTAHCIDIGDHFEWIIEEETRRGNVRILIYGLTVRINVQLVNTVQELVQYYDCDEGWIVTNSIVEKSARQETEKKRQKIIYCYYFDELLEETIDFSNYFEWLENEVKSRRIDEQYIPLACEYTELDTRTNKLISESLYAEEDGWIDGYADAWMQDHQKEHLSILGEFGTGKTWFALHYAWCLLQRYRDAKNRRLPRPRIPIFIPLRDFSKAIEVETLISDFF